MRNRNDGTRTETVEDRNDRMPGRTWATQTPTDRAVLRQCRRQGLYPVASTPEGDVIATRRGVMFHNLSTPPSPLQRITIRAALVIYRWMLDNCARVTTHEVGDYMGFTGPRLMRGMKIGLVRRDDARQFPQMLRTPHVLHSAFCPGLIRHEPRA